MATTFIPLSNNGASPLVNLAVSPRFPQFANVTAPTRPTVTAIPIYPLPGNSGTGSWAFSIFWTLPLLPLMAKLFLLKALFLR